MGTVLIKGRWIISQDLQDRENEIYRKYQDIVAPYVIELEVRDSEFPIEIFNEIRAIFTHLSRYKIQNSEEDLAAAEGHLKRAVLDCYKYLCISIAISLHQFREEYKDVDLHLADNGEFLPKLDKLEREAQEAFAEAKKTEIAKEDDDRQGLLYENAYNAYHAAEEHLKASQDGILFASVHTRKANAINTAAIVVTVISIIITIVAIIVAVG